MYSYKQVDLPSLPWNKQALYRALVYPATFDFFDPDTKQLADQIALVAFADETPVGMIICFAYSTVDIALISSYFVRPDFRKKGIGTQLMQSMLARLRDNKLRFAEIKYNAWEETAPALEKILQLARWDPPQILKKRYYFEYSTFHPTWLYAPTPALPAGYTIFPWQELTKEEELMIQRWINNNPQLTLYSPFDKTHPVEKLNSLGLRYNNELIGWLVTHRSEPDIIRYSVLFTLPEIRGSGIPICLLKESIRRHAAKAPEALGLMEINMEQSLPYWLRFVEKRLKPTACKIENTLISSIIL